MQVNIDILTNVKFKLTTKKLQSNIKEIYNLKKKWYICMEKEWEM